MLTNNLATFSVGFQTSCMASKDSALQELELAPSIGPTEIKCSPEDGKKDSSRNVVSSFRALNYG
jgi:hypothetical protein